MYLLLVLLGSVTLINGQLFSSLHKLPELIASGVERLLEISFNTFQSKYNKVYDNPKIAKIRKAIFKDNLKEIEAFNEDFKNGLRTFQLGVNEFIDLTVEEFNRLFNGFGRTRSGQKLTKPRAKLGHPPKTNIPDQLDLRETGAIGPIKHQNYCGSCYAFSAAAALEAQIYKNTGKLYDLSPQNIVDCSSEPPYDNDGCIGGYPDYSFQYVLEHSGINFNHDYPYEAKLKDCRFNSSVTQGKIVDTYTLEKANEEELEAAVANIGPISAAMDASHPTFQKYESGIYYEEKCGNRPGDLNHAILVIGYGTDNTTGEKYWLCKNTYGDTWGENGYFRIAKNKNNHCGVATWPVYPII